MQMVIRILVGLAGVATSYLAITFFYDPVMPAAMLGVKAVDVLGIATLRGDFAGFFGVCGILALAAAVRNAASFMTAPVLIIGIAFCGRGLSYALDGGGMRVIQPMIVEYILLVIFGLGRLMFTTERTM